MTSKDDRPGDAAELHARAEEIARKIAVLSPEDVAALSSERGLQTLLDLRVHQIELEMQNEELRRLHAELDAARARYFDLFDLAPVGYCTVSEEGLILEANLTAATLLGVARGALVKQRLSRFILKEDEGNYYLHSQRLFETAAPQTCELRMVKKDGTRFWARLEATAAQDAAGAPVCRFVMSDNPERERAEEVLRESEERYRTILEHAADAVFMHDETGRILDVNRKACQNLGYSREELLSKTIRDIDPEAIQAGKGELWSANLEGESHTFESRQVRKDGSAIPVEVTLGSVRLPRGPVILGIVRDITERKRVEEQLRQLQKAESLGRMAGAIAHHFNNQLGVVMGNLELALVGLSGDSGVRDNLIEAMQAARRSAEVSGQLLAYLGQTIGEREPLDLSEACRRSLPILRAVLPEHSALETDLPFPGPSVSASADLIQQILTNLVANASEAVGEVGGTAHVTVTTVSPDDIPAAHRFPTGWQPRDKAHACLEVRDTGCGIADTDMEKLFDPFFSSKSTGRGLGLSVVLGIVHALGGAVTVESEADRGSVFRVILPLSAEGVPRRPEQTAQVPEMKAGGTVLLVEDLEMMRTMAAALLTYLGFSVLAAKDGVEAVEVFRRHHGEIRCVLCDLTMPRMGGWETLAALRKLAPGIPVVLSSGYDEASVMAGGHPEQPQVFLPKPYQMAALKNALARAMGGRPE